MTAQIVTLTDSQSGATASILVSQGLNCYQFQVPGPADAIDVIWSEPGFEQGDKRASGSGIPLLFPFPGRIAGTSLQWDGKTYPLEAGDGRGNALHGFVHERPWRVIEQEPARLVAQFQASVDDAELFERNYRRRMARETSQVMFSLGSIYERQENWRRVHDHYRSWLRRYGRQALPHEVIRAHVQQGVALWNQDDKNGARRHFEAATREWQRNAGERIAGLDEVSDEDRALYLVRAKDATSEALFYLAEYEYAAFRMIRFPRFHGGRSLDRVQRWAERDFAEWLTEKREALTAAESAYNLIAELEIPEWEIAAAARVGEMYRSFMDQIRDAPIPEEIENDDELYGIYVDALEAAARPLNQQAVSKFEFCLTTATRVRWFNEYSTQCEQELNQLDRAQYPMAAELRGEANYIQSQLARPGAVTLEGNDEMELGNAEENAIPTEGEE